MANDSIQCSDADLEPFIRNTFAIQLGNSTVDTSHSTDVGIVSFNMYDIVYITHFILLIVDRSTVTLLCIIIMAPACM